MEQLGYKITDSTIKSMLTWRDSSGSVEIASSLESWQFYNHFPGMWMIARKVELAQNIEKISRILPHHFGFLPKTFVMPGQITSMKCFMKSIRNGGNKTFIVKPDRGSQGRGIVLIQNPSDVDGYWDKAVAQQYVLPYLIDGLKFDLRIYALVTAVDPLRIYIFEEGMARFCTEKYESPCAENLDQVFSHLTNYSLNKKNVNYEQPGKSEMDELGSKRSMSSVFARLRQDGHDTGTLKRNIDDVIRLTLGCVQPELANSYKTAIPGGDGRSRCFEILGFDILIDSDVKPRLLEVNAMPSLACDSEFDKELKMGVVLDALKILDLEPSFKKRVLARQKAMIQKRTTGTSTIPIVDVFDPNRESNIAKSTRWRQLWPIPKAVYGFEVMNQVLEAAKRPPVQFTEHLKLRTSVLMDKVVKATTRQSVSARGARSARRTVPVARPVIVEQPLLRQLAGFEAKYIDQTEERRRGRALHEQIALSCNAGFLSILRSMLCVDISVKAPKRSFKSKRFLHAVA